MKESEFYMGNRRRLMLEIDQISGEKASVEKEFNDKYRSAQRKITEIKENLNRLKEDLQIQLKKLFLTILKNNKPMKSKSNKL